MSGGFSSKSLEHVREFMLFGPMGGSGQDGDVTISANTTLVAPRQYNSLVINASTTLTPVAGIRFLAIAVKGTVTVNGSINADGKGGVGQAGTTGGTGIGPNVIGTFQPNGLALGGLPGSGGGGGGAGATNGGGTGGQLGANIEAPNLGTAAPGANILFQGFLATSSLGRVPGGVTNGGTGGAAGVVGGNGASPVDNTSAEVITFVQLLPWLTMFGLGSGGTGAGAGGGDGTNNGGNGGTGGAGGGFIYIECDTLVVNAGGNVSANGAIGGTGGNGAAGNAGGGGGGAGGGGGCVIIRYRNLTNSGTIAANGGAAGPAGTGAGTGKNGGAGGAGLAGTAYTIKVL